MTSYTGEVSVGGPIEVRELAGLSISKLAVGAYNNNVYLLRCRATGEALLIDAAAEPDNIISMSGRGGDQARTVLTTHQHPDHWQGLAEVVARTGARTLAGEHDADGIGVATDRTLVHGDTVHVGDLELSAIELRGHTPGSIAVHYHDPDGIDHIFTGDSLFPGGVGKTADAAKFQTLIDDVSTRLFDAFGDSTWFYPGHGADSTLGAERGQLAQWRERGW